MLLVVELTVRRSEAETFRRLENSVAGVMKKHGGAIERVIVIDEGVETFVEIHLVRFRDEAGFEAYLAETSTSEVPALRAKAIVAMAVRRGTDGPTYG